MANHSQQPAPGANSWKSNFMKITKAIFHPVKDLLLRFTAYLGLSTCLVWIIGDIILIYYTDEWNDHDVETFYLRRKNIRNTILHTLLACRVISRWRKHLPCILRWLSPWSAEPHTSCLLCPHSEPVPPVFEKEIKSDWVGGQGGIGIFL